MIVLDASVVIAHLSPHDPHHAGATAIIRRDGGHGLPLHAITLAELLVGGVRVGRGR